MKQDIQHHQKNSYTDKGICKIKYRKIYDTNVNKVHYISESDAVDNISNSTRYNHCNRYIYKSFLWLIIDNCTDYTKYNKYGKYREKNCAVMKNAKCRTCVSYIG